MLEAITWKTYLTVILLSVLIYYIMIGSIFYRTEIRNFLKRHNQKDDDNDSEGAEHFSSFDQLENVVKDIRHDILEKAGKTASKAELLGQLSERLANYDGLHQPAFRMALNNYIIQHGESICGVVFSEQELEAAWEKL
ncbi:MAG: hypothetical protein P0Y49_13980 [Candidatus Pedobacter colombiensis]|uniref:Uncharacterized protein n=1 Tax=Candidatus Pedobacter colombiensis TaxID=3121371 RepID=A0AAJ5W7D5_9SPHI|nr:hypothetical protein [Pedobacter sp.]WEK17907.1 MAG: hypothetical protein P0Y49_13980 [Pedobacter sp.]